MEQTEYRKQRYTIWLTKEAVQKSDAGMKMDGLPTRSDFIEKAIHFYSGYIYVDHHADFLADVVLDSMKGLVSSTESRLSRMLFKVAVELAKLEHMLATVNDMDEETMQRLHARCTQDVKRINGILRMEDAVEFQRSDS